MPWAREPRQDGQAWESDVYNQLHLDKRSAHIAGFRQVLFARASSPMTASSFAVRYAVLSTYVRFDIVRRILEAHGVPVFQVLGITDIDDKIITRAAERGEEWQVRSRWCIFCALYSQRRDRRHRYIDKHEMTQ